ncbi:MAG: YihY family inner membrane protein, partial [Myxococcota bacterium]
MRLWFTRQYRFWKSATTHFLDQNGFTSASALAYQTLFSIVPLLVAGLALSTLFPFFEQSTKDFEAYLVKHMVAYSTSEIKEYIETFSKNAAGLSAGSIVFLIISAVMMIATIENAFSAIWGAKPRPWDIRSFVTYAAVLLILPILAGIALAALANSLLSWLPFADMMSILSTWIGLTLIYRFLPNCVVFWKDAAKGALLATILFESAKHLFGLYIQ